MVQVNMEQARGNAYVFIVKGLVISGTVTGMLHTDEISLEKVKIRKLTKKRIVDRDWIELREFTLDLREVIGFGCA